MHKRLLLAIVALFALLPLFAACGPSDKELCDELQSSSSQCPPGKTTLVDDEPTCIEDLGSGCRDKYKALVECQIANPSCNTENADGSLTLDGPIECGDELDKFLGCAESG